MEPFVNMNTVGQVYGLNDDTTTRTSPAYHAGEAAASPGWMAGLTGIPDTDAAAQRRALAMGLLSFGANVAKNNRADAFGRPRLGNLLVQGAYEGMQGLGTEANAWSKREAEAVQTRSNAAKAKQEENDRAWTHRRRLAQERIALGRPLPGDELLAGGDLYFNKMAEKAAGAAQGRFNARPGAGAGTQATPPLGLPKKPQGLPKKPLDIDEEWAKRGVLRDKDGNSLLPMLPLLS